MTYEVADEIAGFNRRVQWGPRMYGRHDAQGRSTLRGCDPVEWPVTELVSAYSDERIVDHLGRRLYRTVINSLYGNDDAAPRLEVWR